MIMGHDGPIDEIIPQEAQPYGSEYPNAVRFMSFSLSMEKPVHEHKKVFE